MIEQSKASTRKNHHKVAWLEQHSTHCLAALWFGSDALTKLIEPGDLVSKASVGGFFTAGLSLIIYMIRHE